MRESLRSLTRQCIPFQIGERGLHIEFIQDIIGTSVTGQWSLHDDHAYEAHVLKDDWRILASNDIMPRNWDTCL